MDGEGIDKGVGFHSIALQIGIAANALGKKEDEVLALCEGLLANHQSDGTRYNTPDKRRAEVQRMLRYADRNVCYTYSKGAIKSLLAAGESSADLDGLSVEAGAVTSTASEVPDDGMLCGVFLTEISVYKRTETGVTKLSALSGGSPPKKHERHTGDFATIPRHLTVPAAVRRSVTARLGYLTPTLPNPSVEPELCTNDG